MPEADPEQDANESIGLLKAAFRSPLQSESGTSKQLDGLLARGWHPIWQVIKMAECMPLPGIGCPSSCSSQASGSSAGGQGTAGAVAAHSWRAVPDDRHVRHHNLRCACCLAAAAAAAAAAAVHACKHTLITGAETGRYFSTDALAAVALTNTVCAL